MIDAVVLATRNPAKLAEMRRLFAAAGLSVEVRALSDFPETPEPAETAPDFAGNALIKARAAAQATGLTAIADDSGISVDVLCGMPGVRSARWAGPGAGDQANLELLLRQVSDVAPERRGAQFRCAIARVEADGAERVWRGELAGRLAERPAGANGFGYDPIFVPEGETRTTAELTPDEKDAISHRGRALRAMIADWS